MLFLKYEGGYFCEVVPMVGGMNKEDPRIGITQDGTIKTVNDVFNL